MRTGRPRKQNADRYPCGKLKRSTAEQIAEAQRAQEEAEMQTVLAQPHRRGNRSQLAECSLGRFCLAYDLPRELYDAGEAYSEIRGKYAAAINAPMINRLGGNGRDIDMEQVHRWNELLREWERVMLDAGGYHGRLLAIALIMDRTAITIRIYPNEAKAALRALALYQGRIGKSA